MDETRRGLLKMFGVGTVIVPLVSGSAELASAAKLIEVPKVELIEKPPIEGAFRAGEIRSATVTFTMRDGQVFTRTIYKELRVWPPPLVSPEGRKLRVIVELDEEVQSSPMARVPIAWRQW